MMKLKSFIEDLLKGIQVSEQKVKVKIKNCAPKDGFSLDYSGGCFSLEGNSLLAAAYGLAFLRVLILSDHITEYLGNYFPKFSIRPLLIKNLGLLAHSGEEFCQRVIALGYNAVIIESVDVVNSVDTMALMRSYGLQLILKANHLQKLPLDSFDFLYWQSRIYEKESKKQDFIQIERAKEEIAQIEKHLSSAQCGLIYAVPTPTKTHAQSQAEWLLQLSKEVAETTYIAFSATEGSPYDDFLPPHPLWEVIRSTRMGRASNLLPLINIGGVNQGEGLWPTLAMDLIEDYVAQSLKAKLEGVIVMTATVPREGALLTCSLWTTSAMIWGLGSPQLLAKSWFLAHQRSSFCYQNLQHHMKFCRNMVKHLSRILSQLDHSPDKAEITMTTELLFAEIGYLKQEMAKEINTAKKKRVFAYFHFFFRDVKRLLFHCLNSCQIPHAKNLSEEDKGEAFWTEMKGNQEIALKKEPNQGEPGSLMETIYQEVYL